MTLEVKTGDNITETRNRITQLINETIEDDVFLTPSTLKNLSVHLSITIIRLKSDNYIPLSPSLTKSYKKQKYYDTAKNICGCLAKEFNVEFPDGEVSLVSLYLSQNKLLDEEIFSGIDLLDDEIYDLVKETSVLIRDNYHLDLTNNEKFIVNVGLHLTPAIERLKSDTQITNPLLDKIKASHQKEFEMAKQVNTICRNKYNKEFSDDEVSYITLHLLASNS